MRYLIVISLIFIGFVLSMGCTEIHQIENCKVEVVSTCPAFYAGDIESYVEILVKTEAGRAFSLYLLYGADVVLPKVGGYYNITYFIDSIDGLVGDKYIKQNDAKIINTINEILQYK